MPNIPTNYEFLNKWTLFFNAIMNAGLTEIKKSGSPFDKLETPFKRVIGFLINKQTLDNLDKKVKQIKVEDYGNVMMATLFIEMDIVISLTKDIKSTKKKRSYSKKEVLTAGQTVAASIGSLFTPPNPLNKLFKVLGDMLSLIIGC
ncbi:MAG: hypothetical protein JXA79_01270 [Deltaproteobacteria bacterium]|nr:hypothetical protein [Deltaproteobacteria bacterium]